MGGDLTLVKDWFESRLVYIQSNTQDQPISNAWDFDQLAYDIPPLPAPIAKQEIVGLNLKANYKNWVLSSEIVHMKHPGLTYEVFAKTFSAGYHYGKWLPMFSWQHYDVQVTSDVGLPNAPPITPNNARELSLSIKYDLNTSSDLKMQYDEIKVLPAFYQGDSRLLTFTYDKVFDFY